MRVLQTIARLTATSSGPATCTFGLVKALNSNGNEVKLLTLSDGSRYNQEDEESKKWLVKLPYDARPPLFVSLNMKHELDKSHYDLYHCNGLWMWINHYTCVVARSKRKKYIISPHGMLYPNALRTHYWKKWLMLKLWFKKDLYSAACLHATCRQEAEHCRKFGYKGPIAVIPNPVVIPDYVQIATSKSTKRKKIGFLGRLHPIKKVEQILYAIALLTEDEQSQLLFQIMGKYDANYELFLRSEVKRLNLENCVSFEGFVTGPDKYDRLKKLWALLVPSESENFGMIVPEALICGTPVYASLGTPWEELIKNGCGWWNDNSPETIARILREILVMDEKTNLEMGKKGRHLIEERFNTNIVAGMMDKLYHWILNGGETPNFLYC